MIKLMAEGPASGYRIIHRRKPAGLHKADNIPESNGVVYLDICIKNGGQYDGRKDRKTQKICRQRG